ncbi:MAG: transglutaminase-like domain-containing protein [Thermoplasmata archaeon]
MTDFNDNNGIYLTRGQCHDFACVLTSLLRAIGIPSRPVSALGSNQNEEMWPTYHIWTEMWVDEPPHNFPEFDFWYVVDCCDEYSTGHYTGEKHIEESIDPRIDYYRSYKILNDVDADNTRAIGNEIYTAPLTWTPDYIIPQGWPAPYQNADPWQPKPDTGDDPITYITVPRVSLTDIKSTYTKDSTDIEIYQLNTDGVLLRNDYDYYRIPAETVGDSKILSFTFGNLAQGDPAQNNAAIWISDSAYPRNGNSPNAKINLVGESTTYQLMGGKDYYICITAGVLQSQVSNGNHYYYTITLTPV